MRPQPSLTLTLTPPTPSPFASRTLSPRLSHLPYPAAANSREEGDKTIIDIEAFQRFLGSQYKSKDTAEGLIEAFKIISNGKDVVAAEQVPPRCCC